MSAYIEHMEKYNERKLKKQYEAQEALYKKFSKFFNEKYLIVEYRRKSWVEPGNRILRYKYHIKDGIFTYYEYKRNIASSGTLCLLAPPCHTQINMSPFLIDMEKLFETYRKTGNIKFYCYDADIHVFDTEEAADLFYEVNYNF